MAGVVVITVVYTNLSFEPKRLIKMLVFIMVPGSGPFFELALGCQVNHVCGVVVATVTRVTPACVLPSITSRRPTSFYNFG